MSEKWHFDYLLKGLFKVLQFLLHFVHFSFKLSTAITFSVVHVLGLNWTLILGTR